MSQIKIGYAISSGFLLGDTLLFFICFCTDYSKIFSEVTVGESLFFISYRQFGKVFFVELKD